NELPVVVIGPPDGPAGAVTAAAPAALDLDDARGVEALAALADALPAIRASRPPSPLARAFRMAVGFGVGQALLFVAIFFVSRADTLFDTPLLAPAAMG